MVLTVGHRVHYQLSENDALLIEQERAQEAQSVTARSFGNQVRPGEVYPAMVVRVWGENSANLRVYLDGSDSYWATSRVEGTTPGTWSWPQRASE